MRQIVLDTETTGLEAGRGHRIIEIGCVELVERRLTGRTFHRYLNPDRAIDPGAIAVHGIRDEFLLDKPRFREIAPEWLEFIRDAELLIHNAAFDVGFLDAELALCGETHGRVNDHARVLDTLGVAREKYPGQRNTLDALCKRLGIDNTHRELHGALLDARLLAEVWLAMTTGQSALGFAQDTPAAAATTTPVAKPVNTRVLRADAQAQTAHAARLAALAQASKFGSLWARLEAEGEGAVVAEIA
ncbi:MAG TPA: DNA polymerase III subunit epsilon [Rhodanobacteraceae bacterium]|nr:DNA polymerase III subunit epsilon [Rhodanobacteraceae bacterium]